MRIMLTSNGLSNESLRSALKELVNGKIKIAFIPTAANPINEEKSWLINDLVNCSKVGEVDIVDISALDKTTWLPRLKKANVIFVGGGNTYYLIEQIKKSGLDKELPKLLKNRVYVGISAGSIVLSKTIQTASEYIFQPYGDEVKKIPSGLGIIDFDVRPHLNSPYFPKVRDKNLRKIFNRLGNPLYALDDNSGIVFVDGKIKIVSEGEWKKYPFEED